MHKIEGWKYNTFHPKQESRSMGSQNRSKHNKSIIMHKIEGWQFNTFNPKQEPLSMGYKYSHPEQNRNTIMHKISIEIKYCHPQ